MHFFDYEDDYRSGKKVNWAQVGGIEPSGPAQHFHNRVWQAQLEGALAMSMGNKRSARYHEVVAEQMLAEAYWVERGRPYVKVYPKMANVLSNICLNVPMRLLRLPHMAFSIRFSAEPEHQLREAPDKPPIQSLFVFQSFEYHIPPEAMASLAVTAQNIGRQIGARFKDTGGFDGASFFKEMPLVRPRPTDPIQFVSVYYQYGEPGTKMGDGMGDGFVQLFYYPDLTITEAMANIEKREPVAISKEVADKEYQPAWPFMERLVSITLASCLMIEGDDDNILPDIPRKLVDRYDAAKRLPDKQQGKAVAEIMEKARKSGMGGITIGQKHELELPRPIYEKRDRSTDEAGANEEGRHWELQWGHYRSPHPRLQPYGPRDNPKYKVKLIDMTRVRKDLPLDPRPKNVRITDRSLED